MEGGLEPFVEVMVVVVRVLLTSREEGVRASRVRTSLWAPRPRVERLAGDVSTI